MLKRFLLVCSWLSIFSTGLAQAVAFEIGDIRIEGLQRISAGSVFAALPINIGDTVDEEDLREVSRALFATGNFDDIQIGRDDNILVVILQERPSISEINIEGNKAIKTDDLLNGLKGAGLSEGQVLKRSTLEGMRLELQRQYVSQGRYDAGIETEVVEQPRNRVSVDILVDEGTVAKIKHIKIMGASVFPEEDLLDQLELTSSGWFTWITGTDKYSKEKLETDIETLESYYQDRGYAEFELSSVQVSISPERDAVYITLNVEEGDKYTIGSVDFSGDLVVEEEELRKYLVVATDQVYSKLLLTTSEDYVSKRLGNDGYSFANVKARPEINAEDNIVNLKFFVDPGKRNYVNRISFSGNARTKDPVLRREMRQMEGAPASNLAIERGKVRLNRLGFFKEVNVETTQAPGTDDLLDVHYTVEEQPSGSIGASVGFAQDSGLILGANLQQNNFLGSGTQVGFGINVSDYQKSANFSYTNPYYTKDGVSRGFSLYYRKTNFDEVGISSFRTDTAGASVNFGYPLSEVQRLRFSLGVQNTSVEAGRFAVREIIGSPRLTFTEAQIPHRAVLRDAPGSNVGIDTDVFTDRDFDSLLAEADAGFLDKNGDDFDTFLMNGSWVRSTLNRGQLATRGSSQTVGLEMSLPGSDLEYYKITANAQKFFPLGRVFTLRLRGELGYGDSYGETSELPFFEHFYSGGFGSVRGFKSNSLGPRSTPAEDYVILNPLVNGVAQNELSYLLLNGQDQLASNTVGDIDDPFGGNISVEASAELLFPLPFIKDQRTMRSAFFIDVGNVFSTNCSSTQLACTNFDVAELRYSFGVGLTWITGFGPLTFSLAKPLNAGEFDDREVFQFSLGQFF